MWVRGPCKACWRMWRYCRSDCFLLPCHIWTQPSRSQIGHCLFVCWSELEIEKHLKRNIQNVIHKQTASCVTPCLLTDIYLSDSIVKIWMELRGEEHKKWYPSQTLSWTWIKGIVVHSHDPNSESLRSTHKQMSLTHLSVGSLFKRHGVNHAWEMWHGFRERLWDHQYPECSYWLLLICMVTVYM